MPWEVELYESSGGRTVLDEAARDLTPSQLAKVERSLERLARHGPELGSTYFKKLRSSDEVWEFRVTADKVEIRLLYAQDQSTYMILKIFKHKRDDDVGRYLPTAERRLKELRSRR